MSGNQERFDAQVEACKAVFADLSWVTPLEPAEPVDETHFGPYAQVAEELFDQFSRVPAAASLPNEVVKHGLAVAARGVALCKGGYDEYCAEAVQKPDSATLETALLDARTVRFFVHIANMIQGKNREYETWFGLKGSVSLNEPSFMYNPGDNHFAPNPFILQVAQQEATSWALRHGQSPNLTDDEPNVCPARRFVPATWKIVVTGCQQAGLLDFEGANLTNSLPLDLNRI